MDYEFSEHARDMLKEREIKEEWVKQTLEKPDREEGKKVEEEAMRLKVDQKNSAIYLRLSESKIIDSEEIKPEVIVDYDAKENVVGIEILGITNRVPMEELRRLEYETT